MADAYEPYHVPQQSRRDKLRILPHTQQIPFLDSHNFQFHPSLSSGLFPLLDADLLSCAAATGGFHASTHFPNPDSDPDPICPSKPGEAHVFGTLMGFFGGVSVNGSSSASSGVAAFHDGERAYDQSFHGGHGGEVLVFKPEPLSLSLSSHHAQQNNFHRSGYEMVVPSVVDGSRCGGGSAASRNSGPLGPFTGYASILKGSRFLKPAQQHLEEICNVGRGIYAERIDDDDSSLLLDSSTVEDLAASCDMPDGGGGDSRKKKSKLISMLDEVYKRYKQYYQQLQTAVASFECVAGLGNAAPYAGLALKALSKHFKCLKNSITDQLQFTNKTQQQQQQEAHHVTASQKVEPLRFGNNDRRAGLFVGQRHGFSDNHPPVWRPQRGLPERAVAVLRAWLFDHFLHPYPTDTDKLMLAKQTGLSRNQVSNWFINARVRVWKPMVEEIHMLETRQAQKTGSQRDDRNVISRLANGNFPENPSTSAQRFHNSLSKRNRNDGDSENFPAVGNETLNFSYGGVGLSGSPGLSSNCVSLTLGLHQNNGMGLPEQFPIHAAQRFGLGGGGEGYVGIGSGGLEGQNRGYGRNVIGNSNQLRHDFVG